MADVLQSLGEEQRLRILLNAITDYAIYMLGPDGTVASWNAGAQRFKGYTATEIIGGNFSQFYTDADRTSGLPTRALATAAREGRFEAEGWRVRKDGTQFWAHVIIDAIYGDDGALIGFAKVTRDLTERLKAKTELQRSEEQFRRLVEGVTDYAIYMLSPDGIVTNWNIGAERIKGYTREEIVGQHFERFYAPEDRLAGEPAKALATARRDGRYEREAWRLRKDGTRFLAHVVIDAIHDETGALLGFAKITRDITERAQASKKLDEARDQLYQSQKLEAIGQLTGGVAHDFNNLLMAILGSLEMASKRLPPDSEALRWIDNAIKGAERGASLTGRLLAFARKQELEFTATDIPQLVLGMSELLKSSVGSTVVLETDFDANLPPAKTDPSQLATAVLNLAVNARDAMPNGGTLTISAKSRKTAQGVDFITVAVHDDGEGMPPDVLERAMEPFFTTKGVGKGTGLGLSMVHGLAQQSGGKLDITSIPGQGTTATIWLPIADDAAQVADQPERAETASSQAPQRLRVLAVDDDALVLMNTTAMLEDLGHEVVEAYSGLEALKHLEAGPFQLVVTDHSMPGMTGAQLIRTLRERWPGTPALLATGYAELPQGETLDAPRLGKPFSQKDIATAIAGLCPKSLAS